MQRNCATNVSLVVASVGMEAVALTAAVVSLPKPLFAMLYPVKKLLFAFFLFLFFSISPSKNMLPFDLCFVTRL